MRETGSGLVLLVLTALAFVGCAVTVGVFAGIAWRVAQWFV